MSETFRQYIKIRTFLGYRPKEILLELQNAFGDEAPTYANVQRWSKRFRDAIDKPLVTPLTSQVRFETHENQPLNEHPINANAKKSESKYSAHERNRPKRSSSNRSKPHQLVNE